MSQSLLSMTHGALWHATQFLAQAEGGAAASVGGAAPAGGGGGEIMGGGGGPGANAGLINIGMIAVMFAVFYFFVMRPQSKRAKEHTAFLTNLKAGDRIVLRTGIFGKLVSIDGDAAKVEIAERVVIKVYKSQIAGAEGQAAEVVDSGTR